MKLHLDRELFREIIDMLNTKTGIAIDILEAPHKRRKIDNYQHSKILR